MRNHTNDIHRSFLPAQARPVSRSGIAAAHQDRSSWINPSWGAVPPKPIPFRCYTDAYGNKVCDPVWGPYQG
jgi:hypothetical protein